MRALRVVFAALSVTFVALATANGCGLDPIDAHYTAVDAGIDVSKARPDSGGLLDAEPSTQPDAALDAGSDADADVDVDAGPCPAQCTSCKGQVCQIECAGPTCKAVACPPGRACKVICAENDDCSGVTVSCASNQPCTIQCEKAGACRASPWAEPWTRNSAYNATRPIAAMASAAAWPSSTAPARRRAGAA